MELQIEHGIPIPPPLYQLRGRKPRSDGICKCGQMAKPGYRTCDTCLKSVRDAYRRRRATGACGWGTLCPNDVELGHSMCREHLDRSRSQINALLESRIARGLCRQCGTRPRILGDAAYCVLHRRTNRSENASPIPLKMRRVIRQFWRLDRIDQRRAKAEIAASYLTNVRLQQIIKLRHGLTDGIDHTLEEIGEVLRVTRERIRQLEDKALKRLESLGVDVEGLRPPLVDIQRAPGRRRRHIPESERKKTRAHALVKMAIQEGRLQKQPCQTCGRADTIAHHPDYDKPLEVEWLCRPHHMEAHGRGKGTKPKQFKPAKGKLYGPQEAAWWLNRARPDDRHYAASQIVAILKAHNVKQKDIKASTGLYSSAINLIVNGKQVKDKHLIAVLRYIESLKAQPSSM